MPKIILLLASITALYIIWQWFKRLPADQQRQQSIRIGIWALLGICLVLVVTGRLHWLGAAAAALFAAGRALLPFALKLLPWLVQNKTRQAPPQAADKNMELEEAYAILGLSTDASKADVIAAHRRLMAKIHPDKGGNNFLAAQLNTAKDMIIQSMA